MHYRISGTSWDIQCLGGVTKYINRLLTPIQRWWYYYNKPKHGKTMCISKLVLLYWRSSNWSALNAFCGYKSYALYWQYNFTHWSYREIYYNDKLLNTSYQNIFLINIMTISSQIPIRPKPQNLTNAKSSLVPNHIQINLVLWNIMNYNNDESW